MNEFKINAGDYILTKLFTQYEWAEFYRLMIEQGYRTSDSSPIDPDGHVWSAFGVNVNYQSTYAYKADDDELINDISVEFRAYLNKDKNKVFSKDDLKDGMRVTMRGGHEFYICGVKTMLSHESHKIGLSYDNYFSLSRINNDLTHDCNSDYDIIRITDRDGTVVFDRKQEPCEVSLEEIAEWKGVTVESVKIKY